MSGYKLHWQQFDKNAKGRDFVVGDVHGYFDLLRKKMEQVKFDSEVDRLFSVGDLIDRGPQSYEVLEWLDKPWFYAVRGNHELMAIEYYSSQGAEWKNWNIHGGQWFMDMDREQQAVYVERFKKMPLVFEVYTPNGLVGIVHAECYPHDWIEFKFNFDAHIDNAQWGMQRFYKAKLGVPESIMNIDAVIYGHNGVNGPVKSGNQYFIDTGLYMRDLTLLEINDPGGMKAH